MEFDIKSVTKIAKDQNICFDSQKCEHFINFILKVVSNTSQLIILTLNLTYNCFLTPM